MCGRVRDPDLFELSELRIDITKDTPNPGTRRHNVPPSQPIWVVTSKDGNRTLEQMRWGLIPSWAKDDKIGFSTFNARADTIGTKPAFRGAWKAGQRCLVLTGGFYEWQKITVKEKQPFAVAMEKSEPMVMAGLWDVWKNPQTGEWIRSCTIITTDANEMVADVHDRMPVILGSEDWAKWLGEVPATNDELKAMLKPFPAERMSMWAVDRRVGNAKNDGADLFDPINRLI